MKNRVHASGTMSQRGAIPDIHTPPPPPVIYIYKKSSPVLPGLLRDHAVRRRRRPFSRFSPGRAGGRGASTHDGTEPRDQKIN